MRFLRAVFKVITPIFHSSQFISGHYFHRFFKFSTNALGIIIDGAKWDHIEKADFFAPYTLPARYQFEFFNGISRVSPYTPFFFKNRKIYTIDNILLIDLLNPSSEQIHEFYETIRATETFQVGGKESDGYGICRFQAAQLYNHRYVYPISKDFVLEFMTDFIPRKLENIQNLGQFIQNRLPKSLPSDYRLIIKSRADIEYKKYYIKNGIEFRVIPQFSMLHCWTNYPEFNQVIAELGLQGIGQFRSSGMGKFRLRSPEYSPISHHEQSTPSVMHFTAEEKQFLRATLLHDIVPKLGGITYLIEYFESSRDLCSLLLKLHYEWHELRQRQTITLSQFLRSIRDRFNANIASFYYKLALADQLAASMTRVKRVPTYSRYVIGHNFTQKIDLLQLSATLLAIDTPFKLWKFILESPELATLNESFDYGDQSLSTHLLLTLSFGTHLLRGKPAYIMAKIIPHNKTRFIQYFWYKTFNIITSQKEVLLYVIESHIPNYPSALVKRVAVKSLRPPTSWLRIQ